MKFKDPIMDINNYLKKVLSFLNKELSLGFYMVDTFFNHFSFILVNWKDTDALKSHHNRLDNVYEDLLTNQDTLLFIADASIKNNVVISVLHIQKGQNIINKSIHHAMNVNSIKAKLFAIRCRINQAIQIWNVSQIVIITDAIPAVKQIFDISVHSYQLHFIAILKDLREFFSKNSNDSNLSAI